MAVKQTPSVPEGKGICHKTESTVIQSGRPSGFSPDPLTEVIRSGARELLASAVQAEVADFLARHEHLADEGGAGAWCATGPCRSGR